LLILTETADKNHKVSLSQLWGFGQKPLKKLLNAYLGKFWTQTTENPFNASFGQLQTAKTVNVIVRRVCLPISDKKTEKNCSMCSLINFANLTRVFVNFGQQ
jgi:hypothetical protein